MIASALTAEPDSKNSSAPTPSKCTSAAPTLPSRLERHRPVACVDERIRTPATRSRPGTRTQGGAHGLTLAGHPTFSSPTPQKARGRAIPASSIESSRTLSCIRAIRAPAPETPGQHSETAQQQRTLRRFRHRGARSPDREHVPPERDRVGERARQIRRQRIVECAGSPCNGQTIGPENVHPVAGLQAEPGCEQGATGSHVANARTSAREAPPHEEPVHAPLNSFGTAMCFRHRSRRNAVRCA